MLLAGTTRGIYRAMSIPLDSPEWVLEGVSVREIQALGNAGGIVAATGSGLFHSSDAGKTWSRFPTPPKNVHAIAVVDGVLHVGVEPAGIYRWSGEAWHETEEFLRAPGATDWPTDPDRNRAWVSTLGGHDDAPNLLIAGVEVGGLMVSIDGSRSWSEQPSIPDDVHHVCCSSPTEWVVSCGTGGPSGGGGVYRTANAGRDWRRVDTGDRLYVRESIVVDTLYTAANRSSPPWRPANAALFVEQSGLVSIPYPGSPESFVISWAEGDEDVFAGTNTGSILCGGTEGWTKVGNVPVTEKEQEAFGVTTLCAR